MFSETECLQFSCSRVWGSLEDLPVDLLLACLLRLGKCCTCFSLLLFISGFLALGFFLRKTSNKPNHKPYRLSFLVVAKISNLIECFKIQFGC